MPKMNEIILFDEQGTPTFTADRDGNYFIGVGICYSDRDEERIINALCDLAGLNKSQPIKNSDLGLRKVDELGDLLRTLPLIWVIKLIDLTSPEFQRITTLYEEYGNVMRDLYRHVRPRPIAQILHTQITDTTIFEVLQTSMELEPIEKTFDIYIDNWSIPAADTEITMNLTPNSIETNSNQALQYLVPGLTISIGQFERLVEDSPRKRLVDVITSVTSRAFRDPGDARYSQHINDLIHSGGSRVKVEDITQLQIDFMTHIMDKTARNPDRLPNGF